MNTLLKLGMGVLGALAVNHMASAAATSEENDQLGKKLTLFGAETAASADGIIPAYTGGLPVDTAPPGWVKGSGRYQVTPFDNEKALFVIKAADIDKHQARLTPGVISMLKKYPDFRLDVYPTHRSVSWPEKSLSHCKANANNAKLLASGNGFTGAYGCVPFPVPKNGLEVMWNFQARPLGGFGYTTKNSNWLIGSDGYVTDVGSVYLSEYHPYHDPSTNKLADNVIVKRLIDWAGPATQVGTKILQTTSSNYDTDGTKTWAYSPGQRRTRLAPEFAFDTPSASYGGANNYDEINGFDGSPERFDWKLIGKKEIYVPYNVNKMNYAPVEKLTANKKFVDPSLMRWELHRVWVVESTLKTGKRHILSRRTLFIDEDTWGVVLTDSYDQAGQMYKVGMFGILPLWDVQTFSGSFGINDLVKANYVIGGIYSRPGDYMKAVEKINASKFTADALTAAGVR